MINQPESMSVHDPRGWLRTVPPTFERISPLYAHLYQHLQDDPELFALLGLIDPDQPIPVLFLSVVTFLVLGNTSHPFAQFYPYVNPTPRRPTDAYPFFRTFCLAHIDALRSLLPIARLQTNEVTRCANLLPAFELVSQREDRRPLALIEIGASAGLNLNWEQYQYTYHQVDRVGDQASLVQIACMLEGDLRPPIPSVLPPVARRVGIELAPVDIHSERELRWLRSCIWPEEQKRYRLLDAAIAVARYHPPHILTGDACDLLADLIATVPAEQTLCLWHSFALGQGPAHVRERVMQIISDASVERTIYRISLEANPAQQGRPRLELWTYRRGDLFRSEWLAECAFHGESMQWLIADCECTGCNG